MTMAVFMVTTVTAKVLPVLTPDWRGLDLEPITSLFSLQLLAPVPGV